MEDKANIILADLTHDQKIAISNKKNTKEYIYQRANEKQFKIIDVDNFTYLNGQQKIEIQCLKCDDIFYQQISVLVGSKRICKKCSVLNDTSSKENIKNIFECKNVEIIGDFIYKNSYQKINIKCTICNKISNVSISTILSRKACDCQRTKVSIKHNKQDVIDKCKSLNLSVINDFNYKNLKQRIYVKCDICNYEYKAIISNIFQESRCKNCASNKVRLKKQDVIDRINEAGFKIINDFDYKTSKQHIDVMCLKCNHISNKRIGPIISNNGNKCGNCNIIKQRHSIDFVKEKFNNQNLTIIEENFIYNNLKQKAQTKCNTCNYVYNPRVRDVIFSKSGCPICNRFENERLSKQYIEEIIQKTPNCQFRINEKIIVGDKVIKEFVLIDYKFEFNNKNYIVEINGDQHYRYIPHFHREEDSFTNQQIRDKWLRKYCKSNNIILIEVDLRKYQEEKIKTYLESILLPKSQIQTSSTT